MTNLLPERVGRAITAANALSPDRGPVVVGLSGGPDSVALLAILSDLGYTCIAAHANFHLRGEESNRDASFARRMALRLRAEFVMTDFDIDAFRRQNGGSTEMACRTTRYQWMREIAAERSAQAIAVGHHRDDNVETILLNLTRGTGIAGLTGMSLRRDDIVRPLIGETRVEILEYLKIRGLDFVTDSTNGENDYLRNRLRNIAIPALTQAVPGAKDGIISTAACLDETAAICRRAVERAIADASNGADRINIAALVEGWGESAAPILFEHLRADGITRSAATNIIRSRATAGAVFDGHDNTYTIGLDGVLTRRSKERREIPAFPFAITEHPIEEFAPEGDPAVAYFDAAILDHKLTARTWRRGDRMHPFGMRGSKLLSDLLVEARIDAADRPYVTLLIADDDEILFAGGVRASSRYAVGPMTKRFIRVEALMPIRSKK